MVGSGPRPVQREVLLEHGGAAGGCGQRKSNAGAVVGEADRHAEAPGEGIHGAEVGVARRGGILGHAMQQGDPFGQRAAARVVRIRRRKGGASGRLVRVAEAVGQHRQRLFDLAQGAHAGGDDERQTRSRRRQQQRTIGQIARTDLEVRDATVAHEQVQALRVERRGQEGDAARRTAFDQPQMAVARQLQPAQHRVLRLRRIGGGGLVVRLAGAAAGQAVRLEALELHRIDARPRSGIDHRQRRLQVAVVVDAGLGDDEDGPLPRHHGQAPAMSKKRFFSSASGGGAALTAATMCSALWPSP